MSSHPRFFLLRRIPISLLSLIIGIPCGLVAWVILEQIQPKALEQIFVEELNIQLDQQARETLGRFENQVRAHVSATRLLANHRMLASYLGSVHWSESNSGEPLIYPLPPPWLPASELWESLVHPSHLLLTDTQGKFREIYSVTGTPLPVGLSEIIGMLFSYNPGRQYQRGQTSLTVIEGQIYQIISEATENLTGNNIGSLMLLAPIDEAYLQAGLQGISASGVITGVVDAEQHLLASSNKSKAPLGAALDDLIQAYAVRTQSFFDYAETDMNLQFSTLVPRSRADVMQTNVAGLAKQQRAIAAVIYITVFTLAFYLLSERLNRILQRLSRFSRRTLGSQLPIIESGNQLFLLENWIRQFMRSILRARDELRQQHETEMLESEALKQAIMQASLDSIITIDEKGRIIEFNSTAEMVFGYKRGTVVGEDFPNLLLNPEYQSPFREMLRGYIDTSEDEKRVVHSEMDAVRIDETTFPVELSIKPLQLQQQLLFTVYLHDITERRRAEKEIISLAKFPAESPSPVLRVNHLGVILYANPASTPLLEYWECELGQKLPLFWLNRLGEILQSSKDWETEVNCNNRFYSLLFTPINELDYVNIYGRDTTAVRQAERQSREHQQELVHVSRLSTMGELATGLAHELNQPLSAIVNFANGCVRRLKSDPQIRGDLLYAIGQIISQADRASEIIRRLRTLVTKQVPVRRVANMNNLVREVCYFAEFEAVKIGIEISQELCQDLPWVKVDIVQIEQVLLNLMRNSMDALLEVPTEDRQLTIQTRNHRQGQVAVDVVDTGSGIMDKAESRLFEPFFSTKESGMGMGLVISKSIIESHQGEIHAEQLESHGTRFTILLPGYTKETPS